ncbi:hypothetical protein IKG06_01625 [Candidatus Saccharibacteria bacterium]|nr:hypothetical protein [Candidatus Saccharibacteria bacterium]
MNTLKGNSIHIPSTIAVCYPQYGDKEETIDMTDIGSKFNGAYSVNNSTICFVVDYEVFVTPYTREAMATITNAGLTKGYFHVPFSNGEYPKDEKTEWHRLLDGASESYYRDYENDCAKWCDEHGVGKLNEETLRRCFKMPREGVPVRHQHFENTYYPVCGERYVDCAVVDKLGCYCSNNGKVVFVYRDGHTYVTKGYWILNELVRAGYKKSSLYVPFSNGEQITDSYLAAQWEKISKK